MSPRRRFRQLHGQSHTEIIDAINPASSLSSAEQSDPKSVSDSRAQHSPDVVCPTAVREEAAGTRPDIIRVKQDQIHADERCRAVLTNDRLSMDCELPVILQQLLKR